MTGTTTHVTRSLAANVCVFVLGGFSWWLSRWLRHRPFRGDRHLQLCRLTCLHLLFRRWRRLLGLLRRWSANPFRWCTATFCNAAGTGQAALWLPREGAPSNSRLVTCRVTQHSHGARQELSGLHDSSDACIAESLTACSSSPCLEHFQRHDVLSCTRCDICGSFDAPQDPDLAFPNAPETDQPRMLSGSTVDHGF